jgi:CRISPR-associated endonuclease Cas1
MIVVADGFGLRISVERGRLIVIDGVARNRQRRSFPRVGGTRLTRLLVLGGAGSITLAALRWIRDVGAALAHLDRDGSLVMVTARQGLDDPRLRRAQANAATTLVGLEVARDVLTRKLAGQARVLEAVEGSEEAREIIAWAGRAIDGARTIDECRSAEAQAAVAYWQVLASMELRFRRSDAERIPEHWHRAGVRHSPLTGSSRLAATPFHAIANYLYALVEAEASIACHAVGLDPGLGVVHADAPARDSLALDVMEAVRPEADAYLLALIRERTFRARDFHETERGVCRIRAPLTHSLAATLPTWRAHVAPVAEHVARILARDSGGRAPTHLTGARRRAAHPRLGRRVRATVTPPAPPLPATCRACGGELPSPGRRFCDDCLDDERTAAFREAGSAALARLMADGRDPSHGGAAAFKRGRSVSAQLRVSRAWDGPLPVPETFTREILPLIRDVPLSQLMEATGLSLRYVSMIRRGERVPHPRHWDLFRATAVAQRPSNRSDTEGR